MTQYIFKKAWPHHVDPVQSKGYVVSSPPVRSGLSGFKEWITSFGLMEKKALQSRGLYVTIPSNEQKQRDRLGEECNLQDPFMLQIALFHFNLRPPIRTISLLLLGKVTYFGHYLKKNIKNYIAI